LVQKQKNSTIKNIGPLNTLIIGYNSVEPEDKYVEPGDEKNIIYEEGLFFSFLNNPLNIPLDSNKNVNGPAVRGGIKYKSKKYKSKKYKSKKYKSKKYKSKKYKSKKYKSKKYKSKN
jgi:hypothetical protein